MARGFAAGLADGIGNAMQMYQYKQYHDGLNEARDERNRILAEKADADTAKGGKGGFDEFDRIVTPIFGAGERGPSNAGKSLIANPGGLSQGSMIPDSAFSDNAPAAYQAGSLASTASPQAAAQPAREEEQLLPRQRIVKEMLFGNLANDPDRLNAINTAAAMSGVGDKVTPWLEGLYKAKKSGKADMAMSLISGDVDGAVDIANRMKTPFADRPKKVNPNDPNDQQWIIQFDGGAPQKIDLRSMIGASMEPEKYLKWQNDTNESVGKRNVSDSRVRVNDSIVDVNKSRMGKLGEETKGIREERAAAKSSGGLSGSTIAKLPAPVATAEWLVQKGVYPDHKSAFNAVKTLNDKSPAAQRQELIKARTQGGMVSLSDAAKEVDDFLGQGGSGQDTDAPSGKVRKFNPATGRFD